MEETKSNTQLAARPDQIGAIEVRQQVNQIQYLMKEVLKQGEHFGVVPGTKGKPTLFQSGAEKIAYMFHLVPSYEVQRTVLDGGHREYEVTCKLSSRDTGVVMGYGMGSCSTLESKYRYRKKWVNGSQVKEENADIADTYNTVLKMAKKRAFVDAVKSTTAASDIFTQDVEDLPMYMFQQQPAQPVRATVEAAPNPEDIAQLKAMTDELAALGYDVDATKRYLWGVYKASGIDAAKREADGMREAVEKPDEGEQQQEPEQDALLPDDVEF